MVGREQCRTLYPGPAFRSRNDRRVFAVCGGSRHPSHRGATTRNPVLRAVIDGAGDGIVVTDAKGRVVYANAAYRALVNAVDPNDIRPVERAFIGDPDVSEAVYRLLRAAREGRKLQEEVRVAGLRNEPARWIRLRVRPLGRRQVGPRVRSGRSPTSPASVSGRKTSFRSCSRRSTISITRRSGFFPSNAGRRDFLSQRDAGELARPRSGGRRQRRPEVTDIVAGDGASLLTAHRRRARRSQNRNLRSRSQDPQRQDVAGAALSQGRICRRRRAGCVAHDRAQPRGRTATQAVRRKCASCGSSRIRRWRLRRSTRSATSRAPTGCSSACSRSLLVSGIKGEGALHPVGG